MSYYQATITGLHKITFEPLTKKIFFKKNKVVLQIEKTTTTKIDHYSTVVKVSDDGRKGRGFESHQGKQRNAGGHWPELGQPWAQP